MNRKPARTAAMRKAFVRRFGALTPVLTHPRFTDLERNQLRAWSAFRAGARWQRRQRRRK